MIKYFIEGGIFMWAILLASICGFAVILEKFYVFLGNERNLTREYKRQLSNVIKKGSKEEILKLCEGKNDYLSNLVLNTIKSMDIDFDKIDGNNRQYLEEVIEENILEGTIKLEKGMWLLGCVVNTAPQLGLLGTVTGMISSFTALSTNGTESAKLVASGISEALYTTAFGLIVAIPALVFFNLFNKKIDNLVLEMEKISINFFSRLQGK